MANLANIISGGTGSPWVDPRAWDSISIGGVTYGPYSPPQSITTQTIVGSAPVPSVHFASVGGKVRVKGASRHYKIDIKDPQGSDGWTITYRGLRPKHFELEFTMWTDDQYKYFVNSIIPALQYSGVKNQVQPVAVYHPALANLGISVIFIEEIGAIEPVTDGPNEFKCRVRVAEFIQPPPINTTATPTASKTVNPPTSPGVQPNPAVSNRLAIIANLNARAASDGLPAPFGAP